jgi:hypothetical protein
MRPFSLALLAAIAAPALAQPAPDPTPVVYLPGGASEEACYGQWVTRAAVRAYSAPTGQSRHIRTVDAERRVDANDYSESLTAVLRPGRAEVRRPVEAVARRLVAERPEAIRLGEGDEVTVLAPAGEGSLYLSFGGAVWVGELPGYGVGGGAVVETLAPVTEVWVRLIEHGEDRPAAWLNTAQAGVVPREPFCL